MTNRLTIRDNVLTIVKNGSEHEVSIFSTEGFKILSDLWLRSGWHLKYSYSFTWLGRPLIQLPEDMFRLQELIFKLQPDVIIETGIAHGGGLIFYASLCHLMRKGRVIGVDIEIRPHNRVAIEAHPLFPYITLIEGSSVDPTIIEQVRHQLKSGDSVLILLDSNHSKTHVLAEMDAYSSFVTPGSYIVAMDGIMELVADSPRAQENWVTDNPKQAALEFVHSHPDFAIEEPDLIFNESDINERVTYWPGAFVRKVR